MHPAGFVPRAGEWVHARIDPGEHFLLEERGVEMPRIERDHERSEVGLDFDDWIRALDA